MRLDMATLEMHSQSVTVTVHRELPQLAGLFQTKRDWSDPLWQSSNMRSLIH